MRCHLAAAALLLLVGLPALAQDPAPSLRPAFREGQTRTYEEWARWTTDTRVQMPNRTNEQQEIVEVNALTRWEVLSVRPDGSATCRLSVDWVELEVRAVTNGQRQSFTVDTRKGPGEHPQIHDNLSEVVDHPLTYTFAPDGAIERVEGLSQRKLRVESVGLERFEKEAIFGVASETQPGNLPETAREGARWTQQLEGYAFENLELELPLTYEINQITSLEGVPVAVVSAEARPRLIEPETPPAPPGTPLPEFRPGRASYNSEIFFDLERREVAARHTSQSHAYSLRITSPVGAITVDRTESIQSQSLRTATSD